MNSNEMLQLLHTAVAEELLERIKSGDAKPADMANAIKFLKDNGIDALPTEGSPLGNLLEALPFSKDDIDSLTH
jgi:hypothetical protein